MENNVPHKYPDEPSITFFTRKKAENDKVWWPDLEAVVEAPLLNVHTTDVAILLAGFLQQIVDPDPPIHCNVH